MDSSDPGFTRRRLGRGFAYLDTNGIRIRDEQVLERISALAIPPAWKEVWICPHPHGHLQAVGVDSVGRKQYLYHPGWRARRDQAKFDRMLRFGRILPQVRRRVSGHLSLDGCPRRRVLACLVRLLDVGFFRIGSEEYAEDNGSYGLATMQKRHVIVRGGSVTFDYRAKGGQRRIESIVDADVAEVVQRLKRRRAGGSELWAHRDGRGTWRNVRSGDISEYLRKITGEEFTAKDFRTWKATVLCAMALGAQDGASRSRSGRDSAISRAVKDVAEYLGNTPAVCRASYIDPRLFDRFRAGASMGEVASLASQKSAPRSQQALERAVLELLEEPAAEAA